MLQCSSPTIQKAKNVKSKGGDVVVVGKNENGGFRERVSDFSLKIRAIRPSAVFGTRRRIALRGEGFAWVPDLGSFLKLREVGFSPYLVLFHLLSTL